MKSHYPDIALDAINRSAALLFSKKRELQTEQISVFRSELLVKCADIDDMLASCQDKGRRANLLSAKKTIRAFLKTANCLLSTFDAQNARRERARESATKAERVAALQAERQAARIARIREANSEQIQFFERFRAECKRVLPSELYMSIINAVIAKATGEQ